MFLPCVCHSIGLEIGALTATLFQGYWMLWANNLLLPSLIFYLLYVLLYRKMHPYPSLAQLREHRGHIDKASEFGEELQVRLTATTPLGLVDAWKTLRVYHKNKTHKAKEKMKQSDDTTSVMGIESDVAAADESVENTQEQGAKTLGLEALSELVDGLERLKKYVEQRDERVGLTIS